MIRSSFLSPTERLELEAGTHSQRENHGVARHANTLYLLGEDTIHGWHEIYRENGWDAVAVDSWKGGQY